jgi:mannose-6-phosphate isomerase-like protein (cupin superfamily)
MARIVPPRGGELIGESPDRRVEILCEDDALHATWARFGPGRAGSDPHVHRRHSDVFYVVEGELTVRLGVEGDRLAATAGTLVLVPPLVVHGFLNASDADVFYLNFHAPGTGFAAYMRGLARGERVPFDQEPPPGDGVRPTSDIVVGHEIETPAIAIAEVTGAAPRGRFAYVLEGELAGSWIEDPPSDLAGAERLLDIRVPT